MYKIWWLICSILFLTACASSTKMRDIKPLTDEMSFIQSEEEQTLLIRSDKLHQTLLEKGLVINSSVVNDYIKGLATRISPKFYHPEITLKFYVLRDASSNAYALPNGNIYINAGLITRLTNQSQLAFVLAHEIAHIVERHGLIELVDRKNTMVGSHIADLFLFGTGFIYYATITDLAAHSRRAELEADSKAIEYLQNADMDLQGGLKALTSLQETKYQKETTSIWSSHPDTDTRISNYEARLKKIGLELAQANTNDAEYKAFRHLLVEGVIKMRIRNKQFELAEDVIRQELIRTPESALLNSYLGDVSRLKISEVEAYAREFSWLHDVKNNADLLTKLESQQSEHVELANSSYSKAIALDARLSVPYRGLGLLAIEMDDKKLASQMLTIYLQSDNISDRRYIQLLLESL